MRVSEKKFILSFCHSEERSDEESVITKQNGYRFFRLSVVRMTDRLDFSDSLEIRKERYVERVALKRGELELLDPYAFLYSIFIKTTGFRPVVFVFECCIYLIEYEIVC